MLWLYLSLLTAFSLATSDALSKYLLKESAEETVAFLKWGGAALFLLPILPFIEIPALDRTFWLVTILAIPLEATAIIFYMRAIKLSPLSLTVPFLALTPIFLIVTSFVMLGESPDDSGFAGIFLIAVGAYLLNIKDIKGGLWEPIKAIFREKGPIFMIAVALIYSITSNLGKIAVLHSSPLFFAVIYSLLLSLVLFIYAVLRGNSPATPIKKRPLLSISTGFFYGIMIISHFFAIRMIEVSYMISVKRTSMIFAVFYGYILFKEKNIGERILGTSVMLGGVVLITL